LGILFLRNSAFKDGGYISKKGFRVKNFCSECMSEKWGEG